MLALLVATGECPEGTQGDSELGAILFWICCAVGVAGLVYSLWAGSRTKPGRVWSIAGGFGFAVAMAALGSVLMLWRILICVPTSHH